MMAEYTHAIQAVDGVEQTYHLLTTFQFEVLVAISLGDFEAKVPGSQDDRSHAFRRLRKIGLVQNLGTNRRPEWIQTEARWRLLV